MLTLIGLALFVVFVLVPLSALSWFGIEQDILFFHSPFQAASILLVSIFYAICGVLMFAAYRYPKWSRSCYFVYAGLWILGLLRFMFLIADISASV